MTTLLPLLSREDARSIVAEVRVLTVEEIAALMPIEDMGTALNPVGGVRVERAVLTRLRAGALEAARRHGYPDARRETGAFDAYVAGLLHEVLVLSAHEAATEEAWSYLTCCWLLDIAAWRFGTDADERRFIGNLNRNTFRRLWWRARVLVDVARPDPDLFGGLGEDELVNIMERPTVAANPDVARAVVGRFLLHLEERPELAPTRMTLMRELMKRLLRLTPFIDLDGLEPEELVGLVDEQLESAVAGLTGVAPVSRDAVAVDSDVTLAREGVHASLVADHAQTRQAALDLATRLGRVTNAGLREVSPDLSAGEARDILSELVDAGLLHRRGTARGTHYVPVVERTRGAPGARNVGTALRRLLEDRRGR